MLIDTHCHLTAPDLLPDVDVLLARAREAGVSHCITIATDLADVERARPLLATHENVFLVAGIHPHEAARAADEELDRLGALHRAEPAGDALAGRLVAVGETGLDFHYDFATPARQEEVFRRQLELAGAVRRPVVIHARESEEQVCDVLTDFPALRDRVVFHCFSGGPDLARRVLDGGWWLSFTGVVTFRKADAIREAAKLVPADRVLVETDAPYLSPEPVRKVRPNEPAFVAHTARFLAELRGEEPAAFAAQTTRNARRFFGLSDGDAE